MRTLWIVEPNTGGKGWVARWKSPEEIGVWRFVSTIETHPESDPTFTIVVYPTRAAAIKATTRTCQWNLKAVGDASELQVRRKDGSWSKDKRTYGKDPEGNG